MSEWIRTNAKLPPDKDCVLATVQFPDGTRCVWSDVRFNKSLNEYTEAYRNEHPNGVWEWAYEAGAGYWEEIKEEVTHWMPYPDPAE